MEFYERVLTARKAKGLSQEALAEALGVSRQAVSKWETGESKPDLDKLIGLCNTLELSMEYLCLGRGEESCPTPAAAPTPKKHHSAFQICIALLCAAVLFVGGYFAAAFLPAKPSGTAEPSAVSDMIACQTVLEALDVHAMTNCNSHPEVVSDYPLCFAANAYPAGLKMEVRFKYMDAAVDMNPIIFDATYNGTHFTIDGSKIPVGYRYRVVVTLTLGDAQREITLPMVYENTVFGRHWKSLG